MTARPRATGPQRATGHGLNPVLEVRDFVRAALVTPVARDHTESDAAFRRRRLVALVTLVVGAVVLGFALRIKPGDPMFYVATLGLAVVWAVGALASGPLHLGRAHTRAGGDDARPIVQSLALGALLLAVFLAGALVVAHFPSCATRWSTCSTTRGSARSPSSPS